MHIIAGTMAQHGGISRYCSELYRGLRSQVAVQLCSFQVSRLARQWTFLDHLPLGVAPDAGGGIYHFTRIMGCSLMLWRHLRPAVATVHDLGPLLWPDEATANPLNRALFRLSLLGLRRMDRIVADSHATARSIVEHLGIDGGRVKTIHLGVDHSQFRRQSNAAARIEAQFGIPQQTGVCNLLFVGSEAPRKNLGTLLQAVAILRQTGVRARLIKVGGAGQLAYRAKFQQQVEALNLQECVVAVGEVAEQALPLFYSAADVFVLASHVEGFGLPVLEAMACATPVVCSNVGALPEVVGNAGLLVEPDDAEGFAAAITALLEDVHLAQQMVEAGLQRCQRFSWDRMAKETIALYDEIHQ